jgi:quercetin dioxygenase-like cupin family protein
MKVNLPTLAACSLLFVADLPAAALKSATVTRTFNEVRILPPNRESQSAQVGDVVSGQTGVVTGDQSRAELKFPDNTLTRLGANSIFRLEGSSRDVELEQGVILMQVPKQLGGARVRTAAITAAVTGTTIMMEYAPGGLIKLIVLEGEVDLYFNEKPSHLVTLTPGEMIIMKPNAKQFPEAVKVDLARLSRTSKLMDETAFGPLGNLKQIRDALSLQKKLQDQGELTVSSYVIEGRGTAVSMTLDARAQIARSISPPPAPPPSKPSPLAKSTSRSRTPTPARPPQRSDQPSNRGQRSR